MPRSSASSASPSPASAEEAFLAALSAITGTGNFHSEGSAEFFPPEIAVEGVGELAFPLPEAQARELIAAAEPAPYGKGTETVRDDAVRKCWQIDASSLSLSSKAWEAFVADAVKAIREELGIEGEVSALPYKLLVYEKGGHFLPHRDTEKLEAMFGTLIFALPSAHEGGALRIRHGGREAKIDFGGRADWRDFHYAAFFADCEHEVEPVKSGYRCCLAYNLRLDQGESGALHLPLDVQARRLLPGLERLAAARRGRASAVLLEHSYTEANLSLRKLKGNDSSRARALLAAGRELGLVAHLGLVTCHQSGELVGGAADDYGYSYGRRHRYSEPDDDGEMGEIYEESLSVSHWRDERDRPVGLGVYALDKGDLISDVEIDDDEPDEKESEGFTGNAGCTMDYWYRRAAVVWWGRGDHERILCDRDLSGACRVLRGLAGKRGKADRAAFDALAEAVVERYPEALPHETRFTQDPDSFAGFGRTGADEPFSTALAAFAKARTEGWLAKLVARVPAAAFGLCPAAVLTELFGAFGAAPFEPVVAALIEEGAERNRGVLFRILDVLRCRKDAAALAWRVAAVLARLPLEAPARSWPPAAEPEPPGSIDEARVLLLASPLIESAGDRAAATAFLLGDESLPYFRKCLAPLLLERTSLAARREPGSLFPDLHTFAVKRLAGETARELKPYPDWMRPCPWPEEAQPSPARWGYLRSPSGSPALIEELVRFMADPEAQSHDFRRAQDDRSFLEEIIMRHSLDLDCTTIRKGSPHTLRVVKNDASHRRALEVRAEVEELLAKLRKSGP